VPKVKIECDQRFLKPHSQIERVLQEHGRLDAKELADVASGDKPFFIEVEDIAHAERLAESLNQIMDVKATVEA
jgi:uncharacterized phage-associated protein